jgi:hypothetical protein
MLRICFSLFVTGIVMGLGPCLLACGPVLITYIAATKSSPLEGLRSWFIFSVSRFFITVLLGFLAGIAGAGLFRRFYFDMPGNIIWMLGGSFIFLLGVLVFSGKKSNISLCRILNESMIEKDTKSLITLGILIGIIPCAPLIGIFSYITMISEHLTDGIFLSASFGLGTALSPLLIASLLAGAIPSLKVLKGQKSLAIFKKICGLILMALGLHIIIKSIINI